MTCNCTHDSTNHGPRMAREGKPRTLASACLESDCPCTLFTPAQEKGASQAEMCSRISDDEKARRVRSLERQVRQIQIQIQELKQQIGL